MSTKKNLTVATLAALLAVPAFGGTNISHDLHMPSTTVHASNVFFGDDENPYSQAAWHNKGNSGYFGSFNRNGHHFTVSQRQPGGAITAVDGNSNLSNEQVADAFNGTAQSGSGIKAINSNNQNSSFNNSTDSNNSTQYASKNELPQTGENNGTSKAATLGATALTTSLGLMALSLAKKHKDLEAVDTDTDNVSVANGKGNDNKPHYSDKSNYDMIMSHTFANLGKHLINL